MIDSIYSLAERIIIWLGSAGGDSGLGMPFVGRAKAENFRDRPLRAERPLFESSHDCTTTSSVLIYIFPYVGEEFHENIMKIRTRVWISQEAFVQASNCEVRQSRFSFRDLRCSKGIEPWLVQGITENVAELHAFQGRLLRSLFEQLGGQEAPECHQGDDISILVDVNNELATTQHCSHDRMYGTVGIWTYSG